MADTGASRLINAVLEEADAAGNPGKLELRLIVSKAGNNLPPTKLYVMANDGSLDYSPGYQK